MKDGFDMVTDVWALINIPSVTSLLGAGGVVWRDVKPANRGANYCDIVVNSLGVTNSQMQRGIANVNIFVPTIARQQPDGSKQPMPDREKLNAITKAVQPLLDTRWMPTFHTEIEDTGDPVQDTDGSWYVNIELNYYSIQTNYQNI